MRPGWNACNRKKSAENTERPGGGGVKPDDRLPAKTRKRPYSGFPVSVNKISLER